MFNRNGIACICLLGAIVPLESYGQARPPVSAEQSPSAPTILPKPIRTVMTCEALGIYDKPSSDASRKGLGRFLNNEAIDLTEIRGNDTAILFYDFDYNSHDPNQRPVKRVGWVKTSGLCELAKEQEGNRSWLTQQLERRVHTDDPPSKAARTFLQIVLRECKRPEEEHSSWFESLVSSENIYNQLGISGERTTFWLREHQGGVYEEPTVVLASEAEKRNDGLVWRASFGFHSKIVRTASLSIDSWAHQKDCPSQCTLALAADSSPDPSATSSGTGGSARFAYIQRPRKSEWSPWRDDYEGTVSMQKDRHGITFAGYGSRAPVNYNDVFVEPMSCDALVSSAPFDSSRFILETTPKPLRSSESKSHITPAATTRQVAPPESNTLKLLNRVEPVYPALAKAAVVGNVMIRLIATVSEEGKVERVQIVSGHPLLNQAAQEAVMKWKYAPMAKSMTTTIEIMYTPRQ